MHISLHRQAIPVHTCMFWLYIQCSSTYATKQSQFILVCSDSAYPMQLYLHHQAIPVHTPRFWLCISDAPLLTSPSNSNSYSYVLTLHIQCSSTYIIKQFQFILICSHSSINTDSCYYNSRSVNRETNCIGRAIPSVPRTTLISACETGWSSVKHSSTCSL
jgi:hypothetical protein